MLCDGKESNQSINQSIECSVVLCDGKESNQSINPLSALLCCVTEKNQINQSSDRFNVKGNIILCFFLSRFAGCSWGENRVMHFRRESLGRLGDWKFAASLRHIPWFPEKHLRFVFCIVPICFVTVDLTATNNSSLLSVTLLDISLGLLTLIRKTSVDTLNCFFFRRLLPKPPRANSVFDNPTLLKKKEW